MRNTYRNIRVLGDKQREKGTMILMRFDYCVVTVAKDTVETLSKTNTIADG